MINPLRLSVERYVAATASTGPTPGGGSAAAVAGALAAGLIEKIVYLTRLRSLQPIRRRAGQLRQRLLTDAENDRKAYLTLVRLRNRRGISARRRQQAWLRAAVVPTNIVMRCTEVERLGRKVVTHADQWLGPDVRCAVALAQAGARGARALAQMNLDHLPDTLATRRLRQKLK